LAFSTAIRKARDLGRRSLALALAPARPLHPLARYTRRPADSILVLHRGENPTTGYYLRPRIERMDLPAAYADVDSDPASCELIGDEGGRSILVIVCRYASAAWLERLEALRPRIARMVYFVDDDLPAMMRDPTLPLSARGKAAAYYGRHIETLERLCAEVWVSTPALAARQVVAAPVLPPLPDADPPDAAPADAALVAYHGTDSHRQERDFVVEVARRLEMLGISARLEITGDESLRRACTGLASVTVVPQVAWPAYLAGQRKRFAAMLLAPLAPSTVNEVRAPVKMFDAARLGAAGLYADTAPYAGFVQNGRHGLLLPHDPQAWAEAIATLIADPARRRGLANAARDRVLALRRRPSGFPPPPG
jgi:hypothetical protein